MTPKLMGHQNFSKKGNFSILTGIDGSYTGQVTKTKSVGIDYLYHLSQLTFVQSSLVTELWAKQTPKNTDGAISP